MCINCGTISHLDHMCKKPKNFSNEFACGYITPFTHKTYEKYAMSDQQISSGSNMKSKFVEGCTNTLQNSRANHSHKYNSTSSSSNSCKNFLNKTKDTQKLKR